MRVRVGQGRSRRLAGLMLVERKDAEIVLVDNGRRLLVLGPWLLLSDPEGTGTGVKVELVIATSGPGQSLHKGKQSPVYLEIRIAGGEILRAFTRSIGRAVSGLLVGVVVVETFESSAAGESPVLALRALLAGEGLVYAHLAGLST
jgi:hypothetical protein